MPENQQSCCKFYTFASYRTSYWINNRYIMKNLFFSSPFYFFLFQQCNSQPTISEPEETGSWANATEINARLGKGINIGNTFEAMPSWQSPFDPADLKRIADLGFTHVRLPIRWERDDRSMSSPPYTINSKLSENHSVGCR